MKDGQIEPEGYEVDEMEEEGEDIDLNGGGSTLIISESALSINGDDSRESFDQLSIDTGADTEVEPARPSIRVAKGLIKDNSESQQPSLGILATHLSGPAGTKRKQTSPSVTVGNGLVGLPLKKQRPNAHENELEISSLEKEIKALEWLARKKEQEWDQIIRLLKQKEEKLMKAQRAKVMIQVEADHLLSKYRTNHQPNTTVVLPSPLQPVIVPQQQVLLLPTSQTSSPSTTTRHIQPKPSGASLMAQARTSVTANTRSSSSKSPSPSKPTVTSSNGSNGELETKFSSVLDKASKNLQEKDNGKKDEGKKNTPLCQGCGQKKSEFVCAGCSNRWYCSRECQVCGEGGGGEIFLFLFLFLFLFFFIRWRTGTNTLTSVPAES